MQAIVACGKSGDTFHNAGEFALMLVFRQNIFNYLYFEVKISGKILNYKRAKSNNTE